MTNAYYTFIWGHTNEIIDTKPTLLVNNLFIFRFQFTSYVCCHSIHCDLFLFCIFCVCCFNVLLFKRFYTSHCYIEYYIYSFFCWLKSEKKKHEWKMCVKKNKEKMCIYIKNQISNAFYLFKTNKKKTILNDKRNFLYFSKLSKILLFIMK